MIKNFIGIDNQAKPKLPQRISNFDDLNFSIFGSKLRQTQFSGYRKIPQQKITHGSLFALRIHNIYEITVMTSQSQT